MRSDRPTLYKIHGHLQDDESVIVTKTDYVRFNNAADQLLWKHLESLMSTKTILFTGYAVEDANVLAAFLRVLERSGTSMRPAYMVGPFMSELTIQKLQQLNIYFIQAAGEDFVDELLEDIKKSHP